MDPLESGRFLLDGIVHNDLYIVTHPEYRVGVEARCNALLESMVPLKEVPPQRLRANVYRSPIYVQEIAHRRATRQRKLW